MSARPAPSVGVIGGGFWGVALALAASRTGAEVLLFSRREHPQINDGPRIVRDYAEVARARLLVIAVPSNAARTALRALGDHMDGSHLVIHGVRGLEGEALKTVSDLVREETPARRVGALGGPVQADELTEGRPSAIVCGSRFPEVHAAVAAAFQSDALHVYTTPDLLGLEWASALVGCLAIGVGFAEEAGAGAGLLAALISRAVDSAARVAVAAGAEDRTMLGLGGYGDLLASIRLAGRPEVILGKALARGRTLDEAVAEARLRVEAIPLIPRVVAFAKARKVDAGVFEALETILQGGAPRAVLDRMFTA
ncbi:NAD(P)-binding domain-containing protein [Sorangium sp. So ce1335]|uniref:NAD(P)-binding domain-containing protein n=1 Tax=Sorangium sp. So ce1335 TaxID=3133335 RepID=UPI003F60F36F